MVTTVLVAFVVGLGPFVGAVDGVDNETGQKTNTKTTNKQETPPRDRENTQRATLVKCVKSAYKWTNVAQTAELVGKAPDRVDPQHITHVLVSRAHGTVSSPI